MRRLTPGLFFAAVFVAASLFGQAPEEIGDVTLTNGKTFKAAKVISQTSSTINIRHAGGITKIEKALLPPELLARFPVDDAMAATERQKREDEARRQAEAERVARQKKLVPRVVPRPAETGMATAPTSSTSRTKPAYATPAEQAARAPYGLYIKNWSSGGGTTINVSVRNPTASPQKMDPRQLQGLADNGQVVTGSDLRYRAQEIANQWVDPGQDRHFTVVFSAGGLVAIGWADGKEWRVRTSTEAAVASNPSEAINLAREVTAEAKERGRQDSAAAQAAAAKAAQDKRLISK